MNTPSPPVIDKTEKDESSVERDPAISVQNILENLSQLKEQLVETNRMSEKPIDIEGMI
jgi:hypothetical protein